MSDLSFSLVKSAFCGIMNRILGKKEEHMIAIGSDHRGYELKRAIIEALRF